MIVNNYTALIESVVVQQSFKPSTFGNANTCCDPNSVILKYKMADLIDATERNPGLKFNDEFCEQIYLNEPAVHARVKEIVRKASLISGCNRVAWLIRAITCLDLTTLGSDDTASNIEKLCEKATKPLELPFEWQKEISTAAVCVYPARIFDVVNSLRKLDALETINIASVATGFPSGQYPLETRLAEIRCAVSYGATEIDVVIDRSLALTHRWKELYSEIKEMRKACGKAKMKTILATGELFDLKDVYKASTIAAMAGSDFVKTSTGKEAVNATLAVGIVMCRAIKDYYRLTGIKVGFKPAGGIKTWNESLQWLVLMKEELGAEWLNNNLFRIGASSVLSDISNEIKRSLDEIKTSSTLL